MMYEFSWTSFFIGILVLAVGAALTIWYRQIADAIGSGAASYERYRLWGLIACGLGLVVMLNLHSIILTAILGMFFSGLHG